VVFGSPAYHALKIIAGCAATGVALAVFVVVPGLPIALKPLLEYFEDRDKREWEVEQRKLRLAVERLRQRRLVKYLERGKETFIVITKEGKSALRRFDIEDIKILKPEKWNERWHIVFFDIPEKNKKSRNALREKMSKLGFYPLQKSVFVLPYECRDEIDFVTRFFDVERYVQYVVSDDLGFSEIKVRKFFGLLV